MNQMNDDLIRAQEAAAQRAARAREIAARQRENQKKIKQAAVLGLVSVGLLLAIVALLRTPITGPDSNTAPAPGITPPGDTVAEEKPKPKPADDDDFVPPVQAERKKQLDRAWGELVTTAAVGPFKPVWEKADAKAREVQSLWKSKQYKEALKQLDAYADAVSALEQLIEAKRVALVLKDEVYDVAVAAEEADASRRREKLTETAIVAMLKGRRAFDAEAYEETVAAWREASDVFNKAIKDTRLAEEVQQTRVDVEKDYTAKFPRATLDAHGGEPWKKVSAMIEDADKAFAAQDYAAAAKLLDQAKLAKPPVDRAVALSVGTHYFALRSGYFATDLLLARAAGKSADDGKLNRLRETLGDLGLSAADQETLKIDEKSDFNQLAPLLLDTLAEAIKTSRGEPVQRSFQMGVQVRLIEKLIEGEIDNLAKNDAAEIKKSATLLLKIGKDNGYPDEWSAVIQKFMDTMASKPEFEAIRQGQAQWVELLRKFEKFDDAVKLVPWADKK
jgi:hypothetical protein